MTKEDTPISKLQQIRSALADISANYSQMPQPQLQSQLRSLETDVHNLPKTAKFSTPSKLGYRVSPYEQEHYQKALREAKQNIQNLRKKSEFMPTLNSRREDARLADEAFIGDEREQQELLIQQQDLELGELANAVERIGIMGRDMHEELDMQGDMLDGLGGDMGTARSRMGNVHKKLDKFIQETGPKQFWTIVILCITFVILTFLVVVT